MTNAESQESIEYKLKRLKLLEEKKKLRDELPHLYGYKSYPWTTEFLNSTNKMVLMTKGNQVGGSSAQIRKCIHWATDPYIRKEVFKKEPHEQLVFLYFMPTLKLFAREFHTKWIPQFMPRGKQRESGPYSWRADYDNKKLEYINFIEFPQANTLILCISYTGDIHGSMQALSPICIFADEEMPTNVYPEVAARLSATGGWFHMNCTPTRGEKLWDDAFNGDKFPGAHKMRVSQYDCIKFEDGSPGVHSFEKIKAFEMSLPSERDIAVRVHGRFEKLEGLVYDAFDIKVNSKPLEIDSPYYYAGIDYGSGGKGHASAIVIIAVSSDFKAARIHNFWKGNNFERTTCDDVIKKYIEMSKGLNITSAFYDWAAADLATIASRIGLSLQKANKDKKKGSATLNSLFKNCMLEVPDTEENLELIQELNKHRHDVPDRFAENHGIDALRYCIVDVPWDYSDIKISDDLLKTDDQEEDRNAKKKKLDVYSRALRDGVYFEDPDNSDLEINAYNQLYRGY